MLSVFYKTGFTSSLGGNSNKDLILLNNFPVIFYWLKPKLKDTWRGGELLHRCLWKLWSVSHGVNIEALSCHPWWAGRMYFFNIKVPFLILKENDLKPLVLLRLVVNGIIAGYHGNICWDNRLTAIDWLENLELFYRGICQMYWQKTKFKVISSLGVTLLLFSVLHGPVPTWSGLRTKPFCSSGCFTSCFFFKLARGVPIPSSHWLDIWSFCAWVFTSHGDPKRWNEVLAWEKGCAESRGLVSIMWGSAVSRFSVKEQGLHATSL